MDRAIEDLTRAIELEPSSARCYAERALTLANAWRFEEALADARRAVQIEPDFVAGHSFVLQVLWNLKRLDELREAMKALHARAASWRNRKVAAAAHFRLASLHDSLGEREEAVRGFSR